MKAQTFWFVFLSLAKSRIVFPSHITFFSVVFIHNLHETMSDFSTPADVSPNFMPFKLEASSLTATEGSCAEIKCHVSGPVDITGSEWFWMKDPQWDDKSKVFNGPLLYSSNHSSYPVSPAFATRVKYVGSASSTWNQPNSPRCSILICNLEKGDSGSYGFRFKGILSWMTEKVWLDVAGQ